MNNQDLTTTIEAIKSCRFVLDEIKDFALIVFDKNYFYHIALGQALEFAGYSEDSLVNKTVHEAFPPEVVPNLLALYAPCIAGQAMEIPFTGNNHVDYFVKLRPIEVEGIVEGGMLIIHHAKSFEHKILLQYSEQTNNTLVVVNKAGKVIHTNKKASELFNKELEEIQNTDIENLESHFTNKSDWEKHFESCKDHQTNKIIISKNETPFELTTTYFQFNDEEFVHIVYRDITTEKDLETKLKEVEIMNETMINRELRIMELKQENNNLKDSK